ncbi:MAG: DUF6760 family protein [Solirubrobacterales bacterium]
MVTYPEERLYEEMGFLAYYYHWPLQEITAMEHWERRKWCQEISYINRKLNDEPDNMFDVFKKR